MQIGFIGLGKMGQAMVTRLLEQGISVVAYNRTAEVSKEFEKSYRDSLKKLESSIKSPGTLTLATTLDAVTTKLLSPRVIVLMVTAGNSVDTVIDALVASGLKSGDIIIDSGNSFYKDSVSRAQKLHELGVHYIDCGTSGGIEGAKNGACLMLGGEKEIVESLRPLWNAIAAKDSWEYFGDSGAGHFVKMVHNGVEYGMMQSLAEGFEILSKAPYKLDYKNIATNWSRGSIIRGYLVELLARAFSKDPELSSFTGQIGGGETGKMTTTTAKELGVETPVIEKAIEAREKSVTKPTFGSKTISALRREFGGHNEAVSEKLK